MRATPPPIRRCRRCSRRASTLRDSTLMQRSRRRSASCWTTIQQLASDVDDTAMAVGSDTVNAAAKLYGYVKVGAKDNPGLKPIAEQLGKAFKRANAKATPALAEKK